MFWHLPGSFTGFVPIRVQTGSSFSCISMDTCQSNPNKPTKTSMTIDTAKIPLCTVKQRLFVSKCVQLAPADTKQPSLCVFVTAAHSDSSYAVKIKRTLHEELPQIVCCDEVSAWQQCSLSHGEAFAWMSLGFEWLWVGGHFLGDLKWSSSGGALEEKAFFLLPTCPLCYIIKFVFIKWILQTYRRLMD